MYGRRGERQEKSKERTTEEHPEKGVLSSRAKGEGGGGRGVCLLMLLMGESY